MERASKSRSVSPEPANPGPVAKSNPAAELSVLRWQGTDAELLDLVLSGAPSAVARLSDRLCPDVNRVVWKLLGADPDHNDLVHDIFIKIWSSLAAGKVKNPERLSSWVVAVAVHTVHKELRRRYVRRRLRGAVPSAEPVCATNELEARDLLRSVYTILSQIPPREQLAFSLRYLDQRQLAEVARLCACSLATVKRRLMRAEQRFARLAHSYPAVMDLVSGRNWGNEP